MAGFDSLGTGEGCVLWGFVVGVFVCFVFKLHVSTDKKLSFQVSCC